MVLPTVGEKLRNEMAAYLRIIQGLAQGQVLTVPEDQPVTIGRSSQASYAVDEGLIEGFQILERLSSQGASSVYKAKQLLMERLVTLKTIVASSDTDEKDLRRFMREAKMGGKLSHPSIVELYDVNEQEGLMY